MSLTTSQKYVLAALAPQNKLSVLKKGNYGICLAASCIWDLLDTQTAVIREKKDLEIVADLPVEFEYCRSMYEELVSKKGRKPEKIIAGLTMTLTDSRLMKTAEEIVKQLSDQGYVTEADASALFGQKIWKTKENILEHDLSVLRKVAACEETCCGNDIMLAVLVLESGVAKKLLNQTDFKRLKESVGKLDTCNIQPNVKKIIAFVAQEIAGAAAVAAVSTILVN